MFKNLADPDGDYKVRLENDPNNLGKFTSDIYWSSTEHIFAGRAWAQIFWSHSNQAIDWKDKGFRVRAARVF